MKKVPCPTCQKLITYTPTNPNRPFCLERCKLIDLGAWASESYKIPVSPQEGFEENDIEDIIEKDEDSF